MPKSPNGPDAVSNSPKSPYPERKRASSRILLRKLPTDAEINSLMAQYDDDNDASFAVRSCSYVHKMLEKLIRTKFRELSADDDAFLFDGGRNGLIAGFSNQLRLSFALQYIDFDTYDDLMLMNNIRNSFAHSLHPATFETGPIADDCKKLAVYEATVSMQNEWETKTGQKSKNSIGRATYHNSVFMYFHALWLSVNGNPGFPATPQGFLDLLKAVPRSRYVSPWKS